ncbi:thioesterase II family protein [Sorangium sp. So ce1128]
MVSKQLHGPYENQWFFVPRRSPRPRVRLLCFPYAGGNANLFRTWPDDLQASTEVWAVHLPGRGARFGEPAFTRMAPLLDALEEVMVQSLDTPYALFGHSMGGLVAFELTRRLRRRGAALPVHLFISGREAPEVPDVAIHALPDDEFIAALSHYGGMPANVLREPELMKVLLPVLRADFAVFETWKHVKEEPLDLPISVFGGLDDAMLPLPHIDGWCAQTRGKFAVHLFPGDHFFLQTVQPTLLSVVAQALERDLRAAEGRAA